MTPVVQRPIRTPDGCDCVICASTHGCRAQLHEWWWVSQASTVCDRPGPITHHPCGPEAAYGYFHLRVGIVVATLRGKGCSRSAGEGTEGHGWCTAGRTVHRVARRCCEHLQRTLKPLLGALWGLSVPPHPKSLPDEIRLKSLSPTNRSSVLSSGCPQSQ